MVGLRIRAVFVVGAMSLAPALGCGDDVVVGGTGTDSATGTGTTGQLSVTVGETIVLDSTGTGVESESASATGTTGLDSTGTGTDTDTDTDTGGPMQMGHTASSFVNAGTVSQSPGYRLVWSFGQETQNQNTMDSPGYTLHGGLIGAIE